MTIDDIRSAYPTPIAGKKAGYPYRGDEYCVGGSYCLSLGYTDSELRFPMVRELARILKGHNPDLCWDGAYEYARSIIDYNDAERFEEAWQLLAQVLPVTTA